MPAKLLPQVEKIYLSFALSNFPKFELISLLNRMVCSKAIVFLAWQPLLLPYNLFFIAIVDIKLSFCEQKHPTKMPKKRKTTLLVH